MILKFYFIHNNLMTATNQINNEQIKIIIDEANSKPVSKRGRPRKYFTQEERRAAINQQLREYRQRKKDKYNELLRQLEEMKNKK